ncbi:MAG: biotin carboxylase N-terminal domain-containing protein [Desulfotomaculaceae bacterium]|nr:biotin carboxylase N-terminal domain-containing protein [Desulfotomaculaceae bacterium]
MFKKILVANRGEIARRIMNACRDLGIKTVAIYSDADKDAFYLKGADETYNIGPANPMRSYLNIEAIISAIKESGADAVHPGYGFLSENYNFAEAVVSNGAAWIGPPPEVMKAIESKCYCRKIASGVDVPITPGTIEPLKSLDELYEVIQKTGLPVLLKLDKGGGGKGIEVIRDISQAKDVWERVLRVGMVAFNSSDCYLETLVVNPRHIEVQFISSKTGKCICLGERECSTQRKHQKIIEESPSPVVTEKDRQALYEYTRKLVVAMGYEGAGTIEFLRSETGEYYFMEINARLQVEHPVTEFITGIDIVKKQFEIAAGEDLLLNQDDIALEGHAIEARVYAEDPITFAPAPGKIAKLSFPEMDSRYLRIDHAIEEGSSVLPYYDSLIAKVIVWDKTRQEAISRLERALTNFKVEGIKTTTPLNLRILASREYRDGNFDTSLIEILLKS